MKLEKRSSFGWPATKAGWAPCKNGLVVHYDGSNQGLAKKSHTYCRTYWRETRKFHMGASRGWLDIGYSFAVCPHGYVFEGRGWQRQQAAQPGGNSTWTSCTFMSGPSEKPTAAQTAAFRDLRAWLRGKGLAAAVSYHSRFSSTSCPGSILRGMVTSGSLIKAPKPPQEDDMPLNADDLKKIKDVVTDAVYDDDVLPAPGSNPGDPFDPENNPGFGPENKTWAGKSFGKQTVQGLIVVNEKVDKVAAGLEKATGELAAIKALLAPKE